MNKGEFILNNGLYIPSVGFGTWQIENGQEAYEAVRKALEIGYRHIDTAAAYENEESVGKAIADSGIDRDEIFVTTKLRTEDRDGYDEVMRAFEKSLKTLALPYIDLYLIHWPIAKGNDWKDKNDELWRAFEAIYSSGKVKTIGVSNFLVHHLEALLNKAGVKPTVNQIEYHPGWMQEDTVEFCKNNNIQVEAWSPLGSGRVIDNEDLKEIAKNYNKSTSQLCIRWCLQNDVLPLPRSTNPEHIESNLDVFDFEISQEDMDKINNMTEMGYSGLNPDTVDF